MSAVIEAKDLTKKYGDLIAVNEVSFEIEKGEIFGLLGPNGAGKTTTVEMIEGLRKPDGGTIKVWGIDVLKGIDRVKEIIGVQLQTATIYERIRVGEAIDLYGSYYKKSIPTNVILERVSLTDKKRSFVKALSHGQKQRLAMAVALVNDPEIIFLDEPTTGLDPQARRNVWDIIDSLRGSGKTILLTTHYMEEAEQLCNRVGIIDQGNIITIDTPRNLIAKQSLGSTIEFVSSNSIAEDAFKDITQLSTVTQDGNRYILHTEEVFQVLKEIIRLAEEKNLDVEGISVRKATLEDVFLKLTGRQLRE